MRPDLLPVRLRHAAPLALALVAAWPARAAEASLGRWGLDPLTGDPYLSIQWIPEQFASAPVWRACLPAEVCRAIGGDRLVRPGETAAGTVFESDVTTTSGPTTEGSPVWRGRLTLLVAPGVQGELRIGEDVRPVPARWGGGWGDEVITNALIACPDLSGPGCEYLVNRAGTWNFGLGDRPLAARLAGGYVYAVEWRSARDQNPFVAALPPPPGAPTTRPEPSALLAVSPPAGPIATPAPVTTQVPPAKIAEPSVVIRKRALRSGRRVTVARVRCAQRCEVALRVSDGRRTLKRTLHVTESASLTIVRGERLRAGLLRVTIAVDGRPAVIGRARLRRERE